MNKDCNNMRISRRRFLHLLGPLTWILADPVAAFDLFKVIDPEGKSEDIQKAKQIMQGASSILTSATELDFQSEFAIGESLALEGFKRYGMPVNNRELQKYITLVGNTVARNALRADIPYYFVLIDSGLYNAFACPGGIIFISSTLFKAMNDESELATVLAHEVAHVSHKHALQSIRRAKFFEGVGKITTANMKGADGEKFRNMIGGLQDVLFDQGLDKNMEFEADLSGMECAYRTGYDPTGFIRVLQMLQSRQSVATQKGSWFSTHPPLAERIRKCRAKNRDYPDAGTLAVVKERFLTYRALI